MFSEIFSYVSISFAGKKRWDPRPDDISTLP
jgi:hypothetical protein